VELFVGSLCNIVEY